MLTKDILEKYQVVIYSLALLAGLAAGIRFPEHLAPWETALWPLLGVLLFATFTQVPLVHLPQAFLDVRFLAAAITGNFLVVPLIVWGLLALAPPIPAVRLGILLVLVVPCTDWFITFVKLGGGDAPLAIAFAPVSLLLQLVLLPVYLWWFFGAELAPALASREMLQAFAGLILAPLALAFLLERWVEKRPQWSWFPQGLGWLPVPLLALVVFTIAATQVHLVLGAGRLLVQVLQVYVLFLLAAALLARLWGRLFRLPAFQGRVLAFSFGTRNSFVVLPVALALPEAYELAVVVIVFQSLVELCGMVLYLRLIPDCLFRERPRRWPLDWRETP